jgi:hypothetical protein
MGNRVGFIGVPEKTSSYNGGWSIFEALTNPAQFISAIGRFSCRSS